MVEFEAMMQLGENRIVLRQMSNKDLVVSGLFASP